MGPDLWTAFVFFGFPLVLGLLGVNTGARLCYRAYMQYSTAVETDWADASTTADVSRTWRGHLVRGAPLLLGGGLLAAHSTRWLLRFLG
jgi:hypothetical protein